MKLKLFSAIVAVIFLSATLWAKTTTSQASGDWNAGGTWNNGIPAAGDIVNIQAAHTVTLSAAYDNTGGTINVSGIFVLNTGGSFTVNGTINVNASATYRHAQNAGTIPTCTWNATSTCEVTGTTDTPPGGLGQAFGHFTWNCSQTVVALDLNGALTTVNGNFTINNISPVATRTFCLTRTTNFTMTVGGDFVVNAPGTTDALLLATTVSPTYSVTGNFSLLTSGRVTMSTSGSPTVTVGGSFTHSSTMSLPFTMGSTGNPVLNVVGDFSYQANVSNGLRMSIGSGTGTINVGGNFSYTPATGGRITETSSGKGKFVFNKSGTQTFSTSVSSPFANTIELAVNSGSTLDMSGSTADLMFATSTNQLLTIDGTLTTGTKKVYVPTGTTVVLSSGGTLNTSNTRGVDSTIAGTLSGTGTRTFNNAANYVLNNASVTTGFTGSNTTMNNLTLTASANLGENIVVNGTLLNSAGTFTTNNFTISAGDLTNNGTFNAGASTITVSDDFSNTFAFNSNTCNLSVTDFFSNTGTFTANANPLTVGGNFSNGAGTFTATSGDLNIAGNFTNDATFTAASGTVVFNGTTQTLGGTSVTSFNNITQNNTVGTTMLQDVNLVGVLSIGGGTFDSNGFDFTLISNSSGTASIGEITGTGDFSGNIIMQRYTENNATDWRFMGSPVSGAAILEWTDDFATSGFTGATCGPADCGITGCAATCNWPSIYWYDESAAGDLDQGYQAITDAGEAIGDGLGYWVYLGPNPITYEVTGAPGKFGISLPVAYNPNNGVTDDGWNLVANPYPCAIDWDDADWSKTSIDDAVYIYNSSTGTYASYIAGSGLNGGSNIIASQQAFWVKASTDFPFPVLDASEGVKITSSNPSFLKSKPHPNTSDYPSAFKDFPIAPNVNSVYNSLKLVASKGVYKDEIMIRFNSNATTGFDNKYDAWKLVHPNYNVQNFSSVIPGGQDLVTNTLPALTGDVTIPLRLRVPVTGTYKISRDSVLMLPLSSCIILEDKKTGALVDLRTTVTYSFTISDTTNAPRFLLHIYAPVTKSSVRVNCNGESNGKAIAKGVGSGPWNYVWKNSAGTVVKTSTGISTADTLYNCAAGTYSVTINGAVCGTVTDTIIITEPALLASSVVASNVSCFGGSNATATVTPSGGTPAYSYLWDDGQTTAAAVSLSFGNYSVTVTDSYGCTATASVAVTQPAALTSSANAVSNVSCFGGNNASASVNATGGTAPYTYLWSDAQSVAAAVNMTAGSYSVLITDGNGCTSTSSVVITQPSSALSHTVAETNVSCFGYTDGSASIAVTGGNPPYSYSWSVGATSSALSNLAAGNCLVTIVDASSCTTYAYVSITQPGAVVAGYGVMSNTVTVGAPVTFNNNSSNSATFQWDFGDGSAPDASVNPVHTYTTAGTYTVTLIGINGPCADTLTGTMVVTSLPTGVATAGSSSSIQVVYENDGVYLLFSLDQVTNVNINVYNMLGESVFARGNLMVKNDRVKLELPSSTRGIYIAVSEMTDALISKKIIIPVR